MAIPSSLGREIGLLRAAAGLTVAELSARTGVREAFLVAIEEDREEPSAAALRRLLSQLDPSGASHPRIAALLNAPELDVSGEYAAARQPPVVLEESASVRVWRHKNDQQLIDASGRLHEYTDEGQRAIRTELQRRGLSTDDVSGSDASPSALPGLADLQFDRAIDPTIAAPADIVAVRCAGCQEPIDTEYYDVNGTMLCLRCRTHVESAAETPRGIRPLLSAAVYGLGAAVAGAIIYFLVIAIAKIEIGIVAILIGYMVGVGVRKGARGRGGRRFQILAVALTYAAISLAYAPIVIQAARNSSRTQRAASTGAVQPAATRGAAARPGGGSLFLALLGLAAFVSLLPLLIVWSSLPSGLITALIILIGMRQAWRMTGAPHVEILGPYRVGRPAAAGPA